MRSASPKIQLIKIDKDGGVTGPITRRADDTDSLQAAYENGYLEFIAPVNDCPEAYRLGGYYEEGGVIKQALIQLDQGEQAADIALRLGQAKEAQRDVIRAAFAAVEVLPVTDATGRWWNGGLASALRLDGGKRLAIETGQQSVVFYDIYNLPHDLPFHDASQVIYTVAGAFRVDFDHKQALMVEIDAATTPAEALAIVW